LVEMVNALSIKRRSAALYAVDNITLFQQKFSKIRTILARDAGNQGDFLRDVVFASHVNSIFCGFN